MFNLLIAKERVNKFIQDGQEVQNADGAKDFGGNEDMLHSAIQMVEADVNKNTRAQITLGESLVTDDQARAEE